MSTPERADVRRYAQQTQVRLFLGGIVLFLVLGNGLIWLIYGREALTSALLCSAIGLMPIVLIGGWIGLLSWVSNRVRDE